MYGTTADVFNMIGGKLTKDELRGLVERWMVISAHETLLVQGSGYFWFMVHGSWLTIMTQEEKWQAKYDEVVAIINPFL